MNTNKGVGIIAIIIIIAVVVFGSVAVIRISNDKKADIHVDKEVEDEHEKIDYAKTSTVASLISIKETLESSLDVDAKTLAALEALSDVRVSLETIASELNTQAKEEIILLQENIAKLEVDIKEDSKTAIVEVSKIISEIEDSIKAEIKSRADYENEKEGLDDSGKMDEGEYEMSDDENKIKVETKESVDVDVSTDEDASVESDSSVEIEAGI